MEIYVNGSPRTLPHPDTVLAVLAALGFSGRPVLVEHNQIALITAEHAHTMVSDGDCLEIIQIVAGG